MTNSARDEKTDRDAAPASDLKPSEQDSSRAELLEQASNFLQHGEIKDAPTDRKISFLESKGLTNSEIQTLLGVSRNPDASSATAEPTQPSPESSPSPPLHPQAREVPPIVTYPEFLAAQSAAPPLLTARRLLNGLYFALGAGATMYATNKYLVAPMVESLTVARHTFAMGAIDNLEKLNEKLTSVVSTVPSPFSHGIHDGNEDLASESSADSDPTELFHVDAATQTSPTRSSSSSLDGNEHQMTAETSKAVVAHERRLRVIQSHLEELVEVDSDAADGDLLASVQDLTTYLDGLAYSSPYFSTSAFNNTSFGVSGQARNLLDQDDMAQKVKNDIRSIKGVFLSARNFPARRDASGPVTVH